MHLLGFSGEGIPWKSADSIDKNILDQFFIGSDDDKVQLYLIEKNPKTSREALLMAVAYKAVVQYNETLKENTLVAAAGIREERGKSSRKNCRIALIEVKNMNEVKKEVQVAKNIQQDIMILKIENTTVTEIIKDKKDMTTHEEKVSIEIIDIKVIIQEIILKI